MVVDERAVQTWFIFSSADPVTGILTSPRVARPIVHLFTFILISFRLFGFTFISCSSAIRPALGLPPLEPLGASCIVRLQAQNPKVAASIYHAPRLRHGHPAEKLFLPSSGMD